MSSVSEDATGARPLGRRAGAPPGREAGLTGQGSVMSRG
jgi:hypothetical protein